MAEQVGIEEPNSFTFFACVLNFDLDYHMCVFLTI